MNAFLTESDVRESITTQELLVAAVTVGGKGSVKLVLTFNHDTTLLPCYRVTVKRRKTSDWHQHFNQDLIDGYNEDNTALGLAVKCFNRMVMNLESE